MGNNRLLRRALAATLLLHAGAVWAGAGSGVGWPGLWGPNRDAQPPGTLAYEPGMTFRELWRRPLGKGYSEVVVGGERGYAAFSDGEKDLLTAFELKTGKELWRSPLGPTYRGHGGSEDGPISTPALAGEQILALSAHGRLAAFEVATGKERWSRDLVKEFAVEAPYWGVATSPLIVGETAILQAGGAGRNSVVALALADGTTVWSSGVAKGNGYASPVLATVAGVRQIIAAASDLIFGLKPEDGSLLWSHPWTIEPRQSPVLLSQDRLLLVTWDAAVMLKLTVENGTFKVSELWQKNTLKGTLSPAVHHQGSLYGMNGAYLVCVDAATGEVKWREKFYGGTVQRVGDLLAVIGERSGNFHLIAASPEGFSERLEQRVFNPGARSITGPTFVDGRFLLRNGEELVSLELARTVGGAP